MRLSHIFTVMALGLSALSAQAQTAPAFTDGPPTSPVLAYTGTGTAPTYGFTNTASGTAPITFTQTGSLPPGVTFSNGVFSGTLTTATGIYAGSVTAQNSTGSVTQNYSIDVTNTIVPTVPEGAITYSLAATGGSVVNYLGLPLISDPVYTGVVLSVTTNTIQASSTPSPPGWTTNQYQYLPPPSTSTPTPYFVKMLGGSQSGRVMLVWSNTADTLTVDNTDNSSQTTALNLSGYSVQPGDAFEIFPGDTLASVFGGATAQNPLILVGGTGVNVDTVNFYNPTFFDFDSYYYNSSTAGSGYWRSTRSAANANNMIIYPYSGFSILRATGEAVNFTLTGRVPEVNQQIKIPSLNSPLLESPGYPLDVTLSELQLNNLGSNWQTGGLFTADILSVLNPTYSTYTAYYETAPSTWVKAGSGTTVDATTITFPAGSVIKLIRQNTPSGNTFPFWQTTMPYTLSPPSSN